MVLLCEKNQEVGEQLLAVEPLLAKLYQLSEKNQINDAIDLVIERFEYWLEDDAWDACKQFLREAEVSRFHPAIALSVLSMTFVEKSRLGDARKDYYLRTERQLVMNYGRDEASENWLRSGIQAAWPADSSCFERCFPFRTGRGKSGIRSNSHSNSGHGFDPKNRSAAVVPSDRSEP